MQSKDKRFTNRLLGRDIPDMMELLGFESFETNYMTTGKSVVVFQREDDLDNRYKVEADIAGTVTCFTWREDTDNRGWHQTIAVKFPLYKICDIGHFSLALHLGSIISIGQLLKTLKKVHDAKTKIYNYEKGLVTRSLEMVER